MKNIFKITLPIILVISVLVVIIVWILFGPAGDSSQVEIFIVPQDTLGFNLPKSLQEQKFIKNAEAFQFLFDILAEDKEIQSGGYRLNKKMYAWEVLNKMTGKPDLLWITISTCQRKEQIGEKLANTLDWNKDKLNEWNNLYTDTQLEYFEGVYYPDTYLIPIDESASQVAQRFIDRFNEKFAPLADEFLSKNIKWTTGLKIASLIAREAGGLEDMKIISGVIWNRLDKDMLLQIDATMQYTLGKKADGSWWGPVDLGEKQKDSPYNTYLYKGLPPTPICSPRIETIEAALNPETTDCLFYLHDRGKQIHCAKTFEEHKANIKQYLD